MSSSELTYIIFNRLDVQRSADSVGGESLNVEPQVDNGGRKIPLLYTIYIGCTHDLHTFHVNNGSDIELTMHYI